MLKEDFFTIISMREENNSLAIILELHPGHRIFKGHFPGHPVVPGACMVQMVKEITEMVLEKRIRLKTAANIKFLVPVNPDENKILHMNLLRHPSPDGAIIVSANMSAGTRTCFKFNGSFVPFSGSFP